MRTGPRSRSRPALAAALLAAALAARADQLRDLTFDRYTPLATGRELARRVLTPLTFAFTERQLAARHVTLDERPVDLAKERFAAYLPPGEPPARGWALLVFVAPWEGPTEPVRWRPPLDRHGVILVSIANAGNEAGVLERRLPLALLAWANAAARWPIDPERTWVGGMSGGAKVAEMAALAWPDVFRGAILNAGAEPIDGSRGVYKPPPELLRRFERSALVLATGDEDPMAIREAQVALASLEADCAFRVAVQRLPRLGHEPFDARGLEAALSALERPSGLDEARVAACEARREAAIAAAGAEVEAAVAARDLPRARALLKALDARFGGVAAEASLELDAAIAALE
jgi:pimeloyl-ACP methyl ester carboxylesterase